jgi:membrane associated rhomboid family serine protease
MFWKTHSMIPIGDDNSDRHLTPYVNYILIIINILVFVLYQGLGNNIPFTFAYATVPAEILSGQDIITQPQIIQDELTGQSITMPGLQLTPVPVYLTLVHVDVHAREALRTWRVICCTCGYLATTWRT